MPLGLAGSHYSALHRDDGFLLILLLPLPHSLGNTPPDGLGSASDRIGIEMTVALGRANLRVSQELRDHWEAQAAADAERRMRVPQIVQANILQARHAPDA